MANAIITLAVGNSPLWEVSHPLMAAYAARLGCDFITIEGDTLEEVAAHSRKLEIAGYLKTYDRLLFLDGDVIIRENCPDLFALVPENALGATVEREPFFHERPLYLSDACALYGVDVDQKRLDAEAWFNSGVMVISRCHATMFQVPEGKQLTRCHGFKDQALLNATRILHNIPLHDLGLENNYIASVMLHPGRGMSPFSANIFHTTGFLSPSRFRIEFMKQFAVFWKQNRQLSPGGPLCRLDKLRDRVFFLKVAMKCRKSRLKRIFLYPIASAILGILTTFYRLNRI